MARTFLRRNGAGRLCAGRRPVADRNRETRIHENVAQIVTKLKQRCRAFVTDSADERRPVEGGRALAGKAYP
jgi:hypothetical protein